MSKPDDVPQDVWDTASNCILYARRSETYELMDDLDDIEIVARAIMAAKAEERSAFVDMIEQFGSAKLIRHARAAIRNRSSNP